LNGVSVWPVGIVVDGEIVPASWEEPHAAV
jgi:hypothetical protein